MKVAVKKCFSVMALGCGHDPGPADAPPAAQGMAPPGAGLDWLTQQGESAAARRAQRRAAINSLPNGRAITGCASMQSLSAAQLFDLAACLGWTHTMAAELGDRGVMERWRFVVHKLREFRCLLNFYERYSLTFCLPSQARLSASDDRAVLLQRVGGQLTDRAAFEAALEAHHTLIQVSDVGQLPLKVNLFFGGTESRQDLVQDVLTGVGLHGKAYRLLKAFTQEMAGLIESGAIHLGMVGGHSLGGGLAQAFLARLQGRLGLLHPPACVLLDPQLLNNKQARAALKDAVHPYDYTRPRGLMIDLNYPANPQRSLVDHMTSKGGYRHPGLLHVKLSLRDDDGYGGAPPETSGMPMMGYHADLRQFQRAIDRFF